MPQKTSEPCGISQSICTRTLRNLKPKSYRYQPRCWHIYTFTPKIRPKSRQSENGVPTIQWFTNILPIKIVKCGVLDFQTTHIPAPWMVCAIVLNMVFWNLLAACCRSQRRFRRNTIEDIISSSPPATFTTPWTTNHTDVNDIADEETTIIEGSLEVKLPTIWTDEKQSRAEAERRERLERRVEKE